MDAVLPARAAFNDRGFIIIFYYFFTYLIIYIYSDIIVIYFIHFWCQKWKKNVKKLLIRSLKMKL